MDDAETILPGSAFHILVAALNGKLPIVDSAKDGTTHTVSIRC